MGGVISRRKSDGRLGTQRAQGRALVGEQGGAQDALEVSGITIIIDELQHILCQF